MSEFELGKAETTQFEESKFISPGIHDVKITKIEATEPEGKAPYLNMTFENTKSQTTDGKLYFSDAAKPYSEGTIKEMKRAVGADDVTVSGKNLTDLAKNLFRVIGNKTFRHRFTAEEVQGKFDTGTGQQKNNWFKATIGKRFSSESTTTNPSRLKSLYKTNQYDYKMLPTADSTPATNGKASATDNLDLPF